MAKIPIKQIVRYLPILIKWVYKPFIEPRLKSLYIEKIKPKINRIINNFKSKKK